MGKTGLIVAFSAFCLATFSFGQGAKPSDSDTLEALRRRAEKGDAHAQFMLGFRYQTMANQAEALRWYHRAAEQGDADAQYSLGFAYESGFLGVKPDQGEALRWYRTAAEHGNAHAQSRLGSAYEDGLFGVKRDHAEALRWYRKAAEQGDTEARSFFGDMYFEGREVGQDYAEAARWYGCPKPSKEILASCAKVTRADLPEDAVSLLEKMGCDLDSSYDYGNAVDLNDDGSPEYQFCCYAPAHGPCGSVLIGKIGKQWKDLTAKGGLRGFDGAACNGLIVLEGKRAGFHDICLPYECSPGTMINGKSCLPQIWRYDGSRYRLADTTQAKPSR